MYCGACCFECVSGFLRDEVYVLGGNVCSVDSLECSNC